MKLTVREKIEELCEQFEIDFLDGKLSDEVLDEAAKLILEYEDDERRGIKRPTLTPEEMAMPFDEFIVEFRQRMKAH